MAGDYKFGIEEEYFLVDAETVKADLRELVPEREGIIMLVLLQFARPVLGNFGFDVSAHHVPKCQMILGQRAHHSRLPLLANES